VWADILRDPELSNAFAPHRTGVHLKDKWRILHGDRKPF
jgi:hypothetical protein